MKHIPIALCAALALAGCNIALEDEYEPDPRLTDSTALFNRIANEPTTREFDMPVTGSGRYAGFATVFTEIDGENGFALGDAEIIARFGPGPAGTFSGTVTNLIDEYSEPVPGGIAFSGTSTGARVNGSVTGDVVVGSETLSVDGGLSGTFGGPAARSFFADTSGTLDDGRVLRGTFEGHIYGE